MTTEDFILRLAGVTLAGVIIPINVAFVIGLFIPSVDNNQIFAIVKPSYHDVLIAMISVVSYSSGRKRNAA